MDWNDTVTLGILADTILNTKLLVAGYFLWRWWQRRKRVDSGTFTVHPEQPRRTMQSIAGKAVGVTTTGEDVGIQWIGYEERKPE